ncbi:MAG: GerMN domain-containing protein [Candidatus Hydrogenedens sp.]
MNELKQKTIRRLFFTIWSAITIIAILIIVFMVYELIQENSALVNTIVNTSPQKLPNNSTQQASQNKSVTIYVLSKEGTCLHPLEIQIESKTSYQENCKQILNAMKNIKVETYVPPFPEDITLRGIFLTPEGELIIDLPSLIITKYEKNTTTLFESLFTYSIVDSLMQKELTENTVVKGVKFLIEGSVPMVEFPKHISWSQSFTPDYSLICNE